MRTFSLRNFLYLWPNFSWLFRLLRALKSQQGCFSRVKIKKKSNYSTWKFKHSSFGAATHLFHSTGGHTLVSKYACPSVQCVGCLLVFLYWILCHFQSAVLKAFYTNALPSPSQSLSSPPPLVTSTANS